MRRSIVLLCLAALASACAGNREQTMASKQCLIAHTDACRGCRVACPPGQTPKCVAGQSNAGECILRPSCTCEVSAADPM